MAVTTIRNMRVDDERWAAWEESANAAGVSITKLVVTTMDNAGHSRSSSGGPVVLEPSAVGPPPSVAPPKRGDAAASALPRGRSLARPDWKGGKKP